MKFTMALKGDWNKLISSLTSLKDGLGVAMHSKLDEDGELVLEVMKGHIRDQDLNWRPLANSTIKKKSGNDTIYVESGWVYDNLEALKVRSNSKRGTLFIGASRNKTHPSGANFSSLLAWMEYGTEKMPPRPLIRPSYLEAKKIVREDWYDVISDVMKGG